MGWFEVAKKRRRRQKNYRLSSGFGLSRYRGFKRMSRGKLMQWLAIGLLTGLVVMVLLIAGLFAWYSKDLPRPDRVQRREGFSSKIYDVKGRLLYDVYKDEDRQPVSLDQVPKYVRQATIAVEDKNFYNHPGISVRGMIRAGINTLLLGNLQGGSTLTQQLVKNVLLTNERTLPRKFKELILTIQIERKYSKDEILTMYLNEAPYGGPAWGVGSASELIFAKNVNQLSLAEAAFLAGLPQSPTKYSPFGPSPELGKQRQVHVLNRMYEDGYITKAQMDEAIAEKLQFSPREVSIKAPHFVFYVIEELEKEYGQGVLSKQGLRVYTTLDLDLQEELEKIVYDEISKVEAINITNGGVVAVNAQTGGILAMVGSKDFFAQDFDGQYNVTTALRQPGSAIKPITYAVGLSQGYTPASLLVDAATKFPGGGGRSYEPVNYDGKFHGPMSLRTALASSINIPAVKLLSIVGVKNVLAQAYAMGLTSLEPTQANVDRLGLSLTLGGGEVKLLELTTAYGAFANGGYKLEPVSVSRIEDQKGKLFAEFKAEKGKQVVSSEVGYLISDILSDNSARELTFGTNSLLNMPKKIAVKTGTTNDKRDNWTIGWTPDYVVGVWVGNNDNSPMKRVASGVSGASPIWRKAMLKLLQSYPYHEFKMPSGVDLVQVDRISGFQAHDNFPAREEKVIKGTLPLGNDPVHSMVKVCKGQPHKLATQVMIAQGNYDEKEYIIPHDLGPTGEVIDRWQEGIQEWVKGQSDPRYDYPTEECSGDDLFVSLESPKDETRINSNDFKIKVKAASGKEVEYLKVTANDQELINTKKLEFEKAVNLADGVYTLKVELKQKNGKSAVTFAKIGINRDWDEQPTATPEPTATASPTPTPTETPGPTETLAPTPTP